jgi:hypothetical protein
MPMRPPIEVPIDGFGAGARGERRHVRKILCVIVIGRIGEPVAFAAADNVRPEDLPLVALGDLGLFSEKILSLCLACLTFCAFPSHPNPRPCPE